MKTKVCFKCGADKPLSEYYKHKEMGDGHLNKCKECTKKDVKKHREGNLEKIREYDRNRPNKIERVKNMTKYNRKMRDIFPEKYKAKNKVNNALRDGRIKRPDRCEFCGTECKPHAHHWSYEEEHWLDVEWLCVVCHMQLHHKKD